ncbi:MAG: hypothetical protein ACT4QE_18210 [Anaerolineales bacterium]
MAATNKLVRERFIAKIKPFKRVEPVPRMASVYTTFNEVLIDVRYSGLMEKGHYWFFLDTHRLSQWRNKQRFIECFICGDENTVVFIPDDKIFEWYDGIAPNRKGHWFLQVRPEGDTLMMKIGHGRSDVDAREFLNRFDYISPVIPRIPFSPIPTSQSLQAGFDEVKGAILAEAALEGNSLHERTIDMLAQIGEWSGFDVRKSYTAEPKSPYILDVVWLAGSEIDTAIEVHDSGNETEAKDRLRQALGGGGGRWGGGGGKWAQRVWMDILLAQMGAEARRRRGECGEGAEKCV